MFTMEHVSCFNSHNGIGYLVHTSIDQVQQLAALSDSASVLEKMRKIKRDGGDLTRSLHGNKRAKSVVTTSKESCLEIREPIQISGDLDGDSNQDVLTELSDEVKSNLSKSVASLAVCSGDTVLFACSGLAIERHGYVTRFVTSAELALVFNNEKYKEKRHNVKIEVRHEGSEVYQGFLATYDGFCLMVRW